MLIAPELDALFPLATLIAKPSLGSDHTPLIFDAGLGRPVRSNMFFFELGWFELEGFTDLVKARWLRLMGSAGGRDIVD